MKYVDLREQPEIKYDAARWFSSKWGVPEEAYLECINSYINCKTDYAWIVCIDNNKIVAGLGVIKNDFHNRIDLYPNVCAVYVEEEYRNKGIAGKLLNMVVDIEKNKGISPLYLLTDHIGFYERYGWDFLCLVQGNDEDHLSRMYVHH